VEAGASPIAAPLGLYETTVPADWLDYNGHMSEWCYLLLVGNAADAFFRFVGIDEAYRAGGHSLYTAETHLHHLREASAGDRLAVPLQLLDAGPKSLHLFHTVRDRVTGQDGPPGCRTGCCPGWRRSPRRTPCSPGLRQPGTSWGSAAGQPAADRAGRRR
jgi:acyl-CoA thioesterase FadM